MNSMTPGQMEDFATAADAFAATLDATAPRDPLFLAYAEGVADALRLAIGNIGVSEDETLTAIAKHLKADDKYDDTPAIIISRSQLNEFTGRTLTDEQVQTLAENWSLSSIPEAFGAMTESWPSASDAAIEAALRANEPDEGNWPTSDQIAAIVESALKDPTEPMADTIERVERELTELDADRGTWPTSDEVQIIITAART